MIRRLLIALALLAGAAIVAAALGLTWAHFDIRQERAPLPAPEAIAAALATPGGPQRLSLIDTASQAMPRSAVLDPKRDPQPNAPFVMSYPSFALEWPDGRILLIDLGMNREQALSFGKPLELVAGAMPMQPLGSVAEQLGDARKRVAGVIFTHLHSDHVGGIVDLCNGLDHPITVFMTPAQSEHVNYTTRPGRRLLRGAACVREIVLGSAPAMPVPGFPGVAVIAAGGHTPDSQIVVARVGGDGGPARTYLFAGDIANNIDGINHDVSKPYLYSLLMVPEDLDRLGELRRYIHDLQSRNGITPLVSHDQLHLEGSGIPAWTKPAAGG